MTDTILVTGSEGIIGRAIVRELHRRWPELRVVRVSRASRYFDTTERERRHELWVEIGDLRDRAWTRSLFDNIGIDAVIHAAALPYDPSDAWPFSRLAHDVDVTLSVLAAARDAKRHPRHHVFLSSATVYETVRGDLVETATDSAIAPSSPLALAKLIGERTVRAWSAETGGTHTIWRLFNVVSPDEPHDRPGHIIVDLYRKIFVDQVKRLELRDAHRVRCFTWVDDVAAAIVDHLDGARAEVVRDQIFNLGGDRPKNALELAAQLHTVGYTLGLLPNDYAPLIVADVGGPLVELAKAGARIPSIAKARDMLNWRPTTGFADCVDRFVRGKAGSPTEPAQ